jgi:hypothetical protein
MQVTNCRCCPGCLGTLRSANAASNYLFLEEQNLLLARPGTLMAGPMNGVAPACFTCGAGQIFRDRELPIQPQDGFQSAKHEEQVA